MPQQIASLPGHVTSLPGISSKYCIHFPRLRPPLTLHADCARITSKQSVREQLNVEFHNSFTNVPSKDPHCRSERWSSGGALGEAEAKSWPFPKFPPPTLLFLLGLNGNRRRKEYSFCAFPIVTYYYYYYAINNYWNKLILSSCELEQQQDMH